MEQDPYCYPGTSVLRNVFDWTDEEQVKQLEDNFSAASLTRIGLNPLPGDYDLRHLCLFHKEIFGRIYPWAGQVRTVEIAKGMWFCNVPYIESSASDVFGRLAACDHFRGWRRDKFLDALAELYGDMNALHPFREGNGRAQRAFLGQLAREAGYRIAWERLDGARNDEASAVSTARGDQGPLRAMLDGLVEPG